MNEFAVIGESQRRPDVPGWLAWISLLYPLFYIIISIRLWRRRATSGV